MRNKRSGRIPGVVLLAAFTLAVLFWPRKFSRFAHTDQAEALYVSAFDKRAGMSRYDAAVQPEEMDQVLTLLNHGRLWWSGVTWRQITYSAQREYAVTVVYQNDVRPYARFLLLSDGTVFTEDDQGFFTRYWLTGCDMEAVDGLLWDLTGGQNPEAKR